MEVKECLVHSGFHYKSTGCTREVLGGEEKGSECQVRKILNTLGKCRLHLLDHGKLLQDFTQRRNLNTTNIFIQKNHAIWSMKEELEEIRDEGTVWGHCCSVTSYHGLSSYTRHTSITSQFLQVRSKLSWVSAFRPHWVAIQASTGSSEARLGRVPLPSSLILSAEFYSLQYQTEGFSFLLKATLSSKGVTHNSSLHGLLHMITYFVTAYLFKASKKESFSPQGGSRPAFKSLTWLSQAHSG